MKEPEYNPQYFYLDKIFIEQIVIDETDKISIFGYLTDTITLKLVHWTFYSNFNQLTDILIAQNDKGNLVLEEVSKILSQDYEIPTLIDISACLQEYLQVDNCVFKTYIPLEPNQYGDLEPSKDRVLLIESVTPKEEFIQKNTRLVFISHVKNGSLMVDLLDDALNTDAASLYEKQLADYQSLLLSLFEKYLGLITKGFTDKKARKSAGLKNEILFRMAFAHYKSLKTQ